MFLLEESSGVALMVRVTTDPIATKSREESVEVLISMLKSEPTV